MKNHNSFGRDIRLTFMGSVGGHSPESSAAEDSGTCDC